MRTSLRTQPHGAIAIWLVLAGGCVDLTAPWTGGSDAPARDGQPASGGSTGAAGGGTGGALAMDGPPVAGASGGDAAGAGGARIDGPITAGSGGANATGGSSAGGLDGTTATGGSTTSPDAQSPADQALNADTTNAADAVPARDTARDSPIDAPAGADLAADSTVAIPTQGLVAYYPCELANGTSLPDMSGKGNDAVLTGAFNFATGQVGKGLVLTAVNGVDGGPSGGYATLPAGIVAGLTEVTVTAWFKINTTVSTDSFERVFDFGTGSNIQSMYFTPRNSNGLPQFSIRPVADGGQAKQDLTGPALTANAWHHVAVVLDSAGGHLYVDGVSVESSAQRTAMTLRPADLGAMPNNWIGRSEFATDPYLDGAIDEFRVYDRGLSAGEIATIFAAR